MGLECPDRLYRSSLIETIGLFNNLPRFVIRTKSVYTIGVYDYNRSYRGDRPH